MDSETSDHTQRGAGDECVWGDRRLQRKLSKSCATEKEERAGVQYPSVTL